LYWLEISVCKYIHKNLYNKKEESTNNQQLSLLSAALFLEGLDSLTSFAHPGAPLGEHKQPTTIQIAFMAIYDDP
jgi:hypothetical protein